MVTWTWGRTWAFRSCSRPTMQSYWYDHENAPLWLCSKIPSEQKLPSWCVCLRHTHISYTLFVFVFLNCAAELRCRGEQEDGGARRRLGWCLFCKRLCWLVQRAAQLSGGVLQLKRLSDQLSFLVFSLWFLPPYHQISCFFYISCSAESWPELWDSSHSGTRQRRPGCSKNPLVSHWHFKGKNTQSWLFKVRILSQALSR